jgi:hypothetical protein
MNFLDFLLDAIDALEIPDAEAIKNQACFMAGINPDEIIY